MLECSQDRSLSVTPYSTRSKGRHGDPCRYLRAPPSGIDTSRCWARQCRRTGETPVFCTSVCVCVCVTREPRLSLVPLDAAVTPVTWNLILATKDVQRSTLTQQPSIPWSSLSFYTILSLPILYGVGHTKGESGDDRMWRKSRAMVCAIVWKMQMGGGATNG